MTEIVRTLNDAERGILSDRAQNVVRLRERLAEQEKIFREMVTLVTNNDQSLTVDLETGRITREVAEGMDAH